MSIRTILVGASGGTANDGAVELACRLAQRFQAHLEGLHVRPDPQELVMAAGAGFGMPMPGDWVDRISTEADTAAAEVKKRFLAAGERQGLPVRDTPGAGASASWREETGYGPRWVADRARFFDLVVLGRSERVVDRPYTDTVEETLMYSGRPVLLAPARLPATIGERIAIGWNGSAEVVRTIAAGIDLLQSARSVFIITIGDKQAASAAAVREALGWRGIAAEIRQVPAVPGAGPGGQLLSAARDAGADLLMMGGFSHTPWRELLFGGATREIVGVSLLPLLISH
jgi:nucleotide-binding universal stress UspA family protein